MFATNEASGEAVLSSEKFTSSTPRPYVAQESTSTMAADPIVTVSYTHLDVYKRQFYGSTKKDFFSRSAHGVITAKITYLFDVKK